MKIGGITVEMPGQSGKTTAESLADLLEQIIDALGETAESVFEIFGSMKRDSKGVDLFAKALTKLADGALRKTNGSLKRAVMGFDELNRLTKNTAYGNVIQKNQQVKEALQKLLEDMGLFKETVDDKIIEPVTQWGKDTLGDIIDRFKGMFNGDNTYMQAYNRLWEMLNRETGIWNQLAGEACMSSEQFGQALQRNGVDAQQAADMMRALGLDTEQVSGSMEQLSGAAVAGWVGVKSAFSQSGQWFENSVITPVNTSFDGLWKNVNTEAQSSWDGTKQVFSDAGGFFERTFSNAWGRVNNVFSKDGQVYTSIKEGVLSAFKKTVNGLIDGINMAVARPFTGLNEVLSKIQKVKIGTLQPFASLNWRAQVPQIPHLAKGAVLPANKPFLAVVGDQRHGTNVETPLSTIQEAMAAVMEDYTDANMAGHSATVQVLRQILEAVLGIRISDEVIATAYDRYHRQMGIVGGR